MPNPQPCAYPQRKCFGCPILSICTNTTREMERQNVKDERSLLLQKIISKFSL